MLSYIVTVVFSEASDDVLQEFTVPANVTWVVVPELDWGRRYAFIIQVKYSSFSNLGPPALGRVGPLPPGTVTQGRHETSQRKVKLNISIAELIALVNCIQE